MSLSSPASEFSGAATIDLVPGFDAFVRHALTAASAMFAVFAVMHVFGLTEPVRSAMIATAIASSCGLAAIRVALWRLPRANMSAQWVPIIICTVTWFNSALHLWLSGDPYMATNLGSVACLAGIILLSRAEFAAVLIASVGAYFVAFVAHSKPATAELWSHYGSYVFEITFWSIVIFSLKRLVLFRNLGLQREQVRALAAEHEAKEFAQSKAVEAESNLRRALEADAAKATFLANMSHELRTPLNSILGFSELLRCAPNIASDAVRVADYAGNIHESGSHLLGLINQILDLSKVSAGALTLTEERLNLAEVLGEIVRLLSPQAGKAGVELRLRCAERLAGFYGDELRLRQIVTNLLANAIKFTPQGGAVTASVELESGAFIVAVSDTGVGIAEHDQERVFEPFAQADSGYSKRSQGTGLGLPLAKKLVELHGGTISLRSALGEGTTLIVRFPPERTLPASAHITSAAGKVA